MARRLCVLRSWRTSARGLAACALALVALGPSPAGAAPAKKPAAALHVPSHAVLAGEAVHRVHSGPHLDVQASNLTLTGLARDRLQRIAARYFKATHHRLVITGGLRTPKRQAELMLEKLQHGEDLLLLYDKSPALEVRAAYRQGLAKHHRKPQLVRDLRETIEAQIRRGIYISRHLQAGAADVRSFGMTAARIQAFRAAVAAEPGVTILDEREAAQAHLHLSLL
jgi:hypothetical protein